MTNHQFIEKLAHVLSVQYALIAGQGVLLHRSGISRQEYADAAKECTQIAANYKSKILASFLDDLPPLTEKDLWESLGLGDLWGPSDEPEGSDQAT